MTLLELKKAVEAALEDWGNIQVRAYGDYEHEIRYADPVNDQDEVFFEIGLEKGK